MQQYGKESGAFVEFKRNLGLERWVFKQGCYHLQIVSFIVVILLYFILDCLTSAFCCVFVQLIFEQRIIQGHRVYQKMYCEVCKICIWHCLSPYSYAFDISELIQHPGQLSELFFSIPFQILGAKGTILKVQTFSYLLTT